jgi:hypothetical protein
MSGRVIRIGEKTAHDFSSVAASNSKSVLLAQRIDVSQWKYGTVAVRVFSVDIAQAGATIDVEVYNDGYTDEDPTVQAWPTNASGTVSLGSTTNNNEFHLADLDDYPMGSMLLITVTGTQTATQDNLSATLSVELILKNG